MIYANMLTTQPCRESVWRDGSSNLQKYVDEFNQKSTADGFQINESKCKEIRIHIHTRVPANYYEWGKCRTCNIGKIAVRRT